MDAATLTGGERSTKRGPGIEAGKGMSCAHKTVTEIGVLTGQGKRMVTLTAAEIGTVTVTEKGNAIVRERGTVTEKERGRKIVTDTGIVKETTGKDISKHIHTHTCTYLAYWILYPFHCIYLTCFLYYEFFVGLMILFLVFGCTEIDDYIFGSHDRKHRRRDRCTYPDDRGDFADLLEREKHRIKKERKRDSR